MIAAPETRLSRLRFCQVLFLFAQIFHLQGTITQSPSTACVGDTVTVNCVLTPPAGESFLATVPRFIIGDDPGTLSPNDVSNNISHENVDLSRFTAMTNSGTLTMVSGTITLSYLNSDEGLRLGCTVDYVDSGTSMLTTIMETLQLVQAALPSAPSTLSISSSNIDPNTCSATISLNWTAPSSTNRTVDLYYLSLQNGTALDSIAAPANSYSHNTNLLLDTVYAYSVSASSCAGNSTAAIFSHNPINSYSLSEMTTSSHCFDYDNVFNMFTINWGLSSESAPLLIQYSLRYNYSHTQGNVTVVSNVNMMSPLSILSSDALTYNQPIIAANFVGTEEIETSITACLSITQQCGQSYPGIEICSSSSTIYQPPPTSRVQSSIPLQSSSVPSASSKYSSVSPTPIPTTTVDLPTAPNIGGYSSLIIGISIIGLLCLIALVVIALLVVIIIFLLLKVKQLNSIIIASKPAPSHPYEYIDLDKMSGNISSPTQQQSPQDYVPMSSVSKQDPTKPPTHYANLK